MLNASREAEIAALAEQYGLPRRVEVLLQGQPVEPLNMTDRIGEVCMVLRRRSGKLLTAIKTFYPPGAFRLLTGGIGLDEPIAAALLREVDEETSLQVRVVRFLSVIEYRFAQPQPMPADQVRRGEPFITCAFLLDEIGGTFGVRDAAERIGSFREVDVAELPAMAELLERVSAGFSSEVRGSWDDWGRFRAIVHRVVFDDLRDLQP